MKRVMFIMCAAAIALSMNACKIKRQSSANNVVTIQEANGVYTIDLNLVEKYWKLIELNGNPIAPANESREAHIIFHTENNRFSGSTGCNRMMGSYQTKEDNQIVLSSAATTQMMCIDSQIMEIEVGFLKALEMTDSYSVKNDTLTLSNANTTLARLVVVYLR